MAADFPPFPRSASESESSEQANSSPSPTLNPLARLWRPAAQRNIRNQWSKLSSYRKQWVTSSSAARSHAASLVNAYLNQKYLPSMEMSVLRDMPDIETRACQKLLKQQELHRIKILSYYKDMVTVVTQMVNSSRSMRCFLKATSSPIVQFSSSSENKNDTEKLWEEITQMYAMELSLKRLLILKLLSISSEALQAQKLCWSDEFYPGEFDDMIACNLYSKESREPIPPSLKILKSATLVDECSIQPNRKILQVYLTTWLAEVSSDTHRVEEIFTIIGEENVSIEFLFSGFEWKVVDTRYHIFTIFAYVFSFLKCVNVAYFRLVFDMRIMVVVKMFIFYID